MKQQPPTRSGAALALPWSSPLPMGEGIVLAVILLLVLAVA